MICLRQSLHIIQWPVFIIQVEKRYGARISRVPPLMRFSFKKTPARVTVELFSKLLLMTLKLGRSLQWALLSICPGSFAWSWPKASTALASTAQGSPLQITTKANLVLFLAEVKQKMAVSVATELSNLPLPSAALETKVELLRLLDFRLLAIDEPESRPRRQAKGRSVHNCHTFQHASEEHIETSSSLSRHVSSL